MAFGSGGARALGRGRLRAPSGGGLRSWLAAARLGAVNAGRPRSGAGCGRSLLTISRAKAPRFGAEDLAGVPPRGVQVAESSIAVL